MPGMGPVYECASVGPCVRSKPSLAPGIPENDGCPSNKCLDGAEMCDACDDPGYSYPGPIPFILPGAWALGDGMDLPHMGPGPLKGHSRLLPDHSMWTSLMDAVAHALTLVGWNETSASRCKQARVTRLNRKYSSGCERAGSGANAAEASALFICQASLSPQVSRRDLPCKED